MRKFRTFLLLAASVHFIFLSCNKEREDEGRPAVPEEAKTYTITASFAETGPKASAGPDGTITWAAGDKIAVYDS